MPRDKIPVTQAIRAFKEATLDFSLHTYRYEYKGGTSVASKELGVDEHAVVKTLVFEDENGNPLLILMHGDQQVSTKNLARQIGAKSIEPCDPEKAQKHTGYMVGGISPFGTRKKMPVYIESTILDLSRIYINAGKRGLLAEISPSALLSVLEGKPVQVAI